LSACADQIGSFLFYAEIGIATESRHRTFGYAICDLNGWFSNMDDITLHLQAMAETRSPRRISTSQKMEKCARSRHVVSQQAHLAQ